MNRSNTPPNKSTAEFERNRPILGSALILIASIALQACDSSSSAEAPEGNQPPAVDAGIDIQADEGVKVLLAGSATDPEGDSLSYLWEQVSGPAVVFSSNTDPLAVIDTPRVDVGATETAVLRLTATDSMGISASDDLNVTVESSYTESFAIVNNCSTVASEPADILNDEIAPSPLADATAETLAVETSGEFTAPTALYERISAELTGILASFPALDFFPGFDGNRMRACNATGQTGIELVLDETTHAQLAAGEETALSPYLEKLSGEVNTTLAPFAFVNFNGVYNKSRLTQEFSNLDGVLQATNSGFFGDGSDICLAVRGTDHFYIFDRGEGDCPAGCLSHTYTGVEVDSSGNIRIVGTHSRFDTPVPAWFDNAADCTTFLSSL